MGCDDADACGTSLGSIVDVVTTDTSVAGLSPFALPAPTTKRAHVRCIEVATTTVTVPAAYSALIASANSGATRVRAQFIRTNQGGANNESGAPDATTIAGSHSQVGFATTLD